MKQELVVRPIGNLVEPGRAVIEKQKGKAQPEQERAFENFEERDDLQVSNTSMLLQNRELVRVRSNLSNSSPRFAYYATIGFSRQQISNLFPSGSSKKNA